MFIYILTKNYILFIFQKKKVTFWLGVAFFFSLATFSTGFRMLFIFKVSNPPYHYKRKRKR